MKRHPTCSTRQQPVRQWLALATLVALVVTTATPPALALRGAGLEENKAWGDAAAQLGVTASARPGAPATSERVGLEEPESRVAEAIAQLGDPDSSVRLNAAVTLAQLGNPAAVAPLRQLLGDPFDLVREAAAWALRQFGVVSAPARVPRQVKGAPPATGPGPTVAVTIQGLGDPNRPERSLSVQGRTVAEVLGALFARCHAEGIPGVFDAQGTLLTQWQVSWKSQVSVELGLGDKDGWVKVPPARLIPGPTLVAGDEIRISATDLEERASPVAAALGRGEVVVFADGQALIGGQSVGAPEALQAEGFFETPGLTLVVPQPAEVIWPAATQVVVDLVGLPALTLPAGVQHVLLAREAAPTPAALPTPEAVLTTLAGRGIVLGPRDVIVYPQDYLTQEEAPRRFPDGILLGLGPSVAPATLDAARLALLITAAEALPEPILYVQQLKAGVVYADQTAVLIAA